ncbi:hypothetical protein DVS28_a1300 [Euzebya pacifica]|uniref:Laminin G domain-containing protein n=1 Tax=Euzebya pacifica TaxID=1608957 RepID=A0A346XUV2_9ACTN|nr:hypothetical protein DVS28_a1300 [Euzebya pacifica]
MQPAADGQTLHVVAGIDFTTAFAQAGAAGATLDPESLVVHEVDATGTILDPVVAFQFDPGPGYDATTNAVGELVVEVAAPTSAAEDRRYLAYFDTPSAGAPGTAVADQVEVATAVVDEGLPAMSITTRTATWWYQTEAGGFSSLVGPTGADWISWSTASGASGQYRGIPNLVYPAGWFHPGATGHTTTLEVDGPLRTTFATTSPDGLWAMQWDVFPTRAVGTVVEHDANYWFLYEGTPGGAVEADSDFYALSDGASSPLTGSFSSDIAAPEWVQFGDPVVDRSLFLIHHDDDAATDSYYTLADEMTVFGFGRSGLSRHMGGNDRRFTVGILDTADQQAAAASIGALTAAPTVLVGPGQSSTSTDDTPPVITTGPTAVATDDQLEVSWATDEYATSELSVGLSAALELGTSTTPGLHQSHAVTATGLACETTYHWAVTSTDGSGNAVSSPTQQTTTEACPAGPSRVGGELVLYEFGVVGAGGGAGVVPDSAGVGVPLDLVVGEGVGVWGAGGLVLSGSSSGVVASDGGAVKVVDAVGVSGAVSVEVWVDPADVTQGGPARIVEVGSGPLARNVMLGQGAWGKLPDAVFAGRVRTSSSVAGTPTLFSAVGSASVGLSHVVLTRDGSGAVSLWVDGVLEGSGNIGGVLSNWDGGFPLVVGNTADGSRPWAGTVCLVAVHDVALSAEDVAANHQAGCPTAEATNADPVIDPVGDQVSAPGATVSLAVTASDPDGDDLAYAAGGLPPGLGIDAVTGQIQGTIQEDAVVGTSYPVTVTVDDQQGGVAQVSFDWTIDDAPAGPSRVGGELVLYEFGVVGAGGGAGVVPDSAGVGVPLDLVVGEGVGVWGAGGLVLSGSSVGVVASDGGAVKVVDAVGVSGAVSVEAWVDPADVTQDGPARIVEVGSGPLARNVMLGQGAWGKLPDAVFAGRVRTSSSVAGTPTLFSAVGSASVGLSHVVLTRDGSGVVSLWVDGVLEGSGSLGGVLSNWDGGFPLVVGNTADGSRPWAGTVCLVAVHDVALSAEDVAANHQAGCPTTPPGPNDPPTTADDAYAVAEDDQLVVTAPGVLANDADPDLDPLTAQLATDAGEGTLTLQDDGSFTYDPDPNFFGTDTFTYRATDGIAQSAAATVTITVDPVDDDPVAVVDSYGTAPDTSLSIAAPGVLGNDHDPDGEPIVAELLVDASDGTLALASDGSFDYAPDPGFLGTDTFTYRATDGTTSSAPTTVTIAVATSSEPPRFVTGTLGFTRQVIATDVDETHIAVAADFDADGALDVVATDFVDDQVLLLRADGTGGYIRTVLDPALDGAYPANVGDVDGDGDSDALAAGYEADTYVWYDNDGSGAFTRRVIDDSADGAHSIVVHDLDGDGDSDLLAANQDADTITWYDNDGAQQYTLRTIDPAANGAKRAEVGDIDGDGDPDVVAASFFDDTIAWHENDGTGGFTKRVIDTDANGAYFAIAGDVDGDGLLDVLSASQKDNTIAWYRNDGTGGWTKQVIDGSALGARTVEVADVDGDGDLDALSAAADGDSLAWYENDGTGLFSAAPIDLTVDGAYGLVAVDIDGDGDIDALSAGRDDNTISVHLQRRTHGATVAASGTLSIGPAVLAAADPDTPPSGLVFTLAEPPTAGEFRRDGVVLGAGESFTQADVDGDLIAYVRGGAGSSDGFELLLSDLGANPPLATTFDVAVDDGTDVAVHLTLDEGAGTVAADASGSGNDGTLVGGAVFDPRTTDGSPSSVDLNGSSSRIDLPAVDLTGGSGLTLALRFRADDFGVSDARLVSQAAGTAANDHLVMLSTVKAGSEHVLRGRVRIGGITQTVVANGGPIQPGTWHHAALTHDGSTVRLFLDGVEVGGTLHPGEVDTDPTIPFAVGGQPMGPGRHFDGLVDDVRMLRRALGPTEMLVLAS